MTVGETEVPILKQIVLLYGVSVVSLGEQEVQLLTQWLISSAATAP